MTKVYQFRASGVCADLPQTAQPADKWSSASNYTFPYGVAERVGGYDSTTLLDGTCTICQPQWVLQFNELSTNNRTVTSRVWYVGQDYAGAAQTKVGLVGSPHVNYTPGGGWGAVVPGRITGGILNTWVAVLNSQTAPPLYWDAAGAAWTILPGPVHVNSTFNALRPYREFLIGMGELGQDTKYRSDMVYWSDASTAFAVPATWVAAATNQAGDATLAGGGEVVDGAVLGPDFLIYKKNAVYRMSYVGGNYVMALSRLFTGWGALSQNCIAAVQDKHYVFTGDDLIVTDGQRWESIANGKLRRSIRVAASTYRLNSYVHYSEKDQELLVCPTQSGLTFPTNAFVVSLKNFEWSVRSIPTASGMTTYRTAQDYSYDLINDPGSTTASSGRIYSSPQGTTFAGSAISATLTKDALDFGSPRVKMVEWVRPIVPAVAGASSVPTSITVEVGARMNSDDSISYGTAATYTYASSDKIDVFSPTQGRYLDFRVTHAGGTANACVGLDIGYEERGDY